MANTSEKKGGSPKGVKAFIIVGITIVIILLIVVIAILLTRRSNNGKEEAEENNRRSTVINEDNAREVISGMLESDDSEEDTTGIDYYSATMNYEWRFRSGTEPSYNAYVENNTDNTKDVYFDLFLADNETEPIFESPIIPVGSNLRNFSLAKELEAGTYDCICVYHLVDDDQRTLSTLRVRVTVIVEQ